MVKLKSANRIFSIFLLMFMLVGMLGSMTSVYAVEGYAFSKIQVNGNNVDAVKTALSNAIVQSKVDGGNSNITSGGETLEKDCTVFVSSTSGSAKGTTIPLMGLQSNYLLINADAFKSGNNKEVKKAVQGFVDSLKESTMPDDQQQSLMQELQDVDSDIASIIIPMLFDSTKADLFTAYKWLYPFLSVLRVVFGIGAVIIILLLMGSTIMDMAYIGLPMWREAQAEKQGNGKHPFGVSYEALRTVQEIEKGMGDSYKNAYVLYFKRRALTYVVLAICLLYLIAGELGGLISWLLNLASGIV